MPFQDLSISFALVLTSIIVTLILIDAKQSIYRILTGRTVVLITILLWYLLEALRLPDELFEFSQAQYDAGLAVIGLSLVTFLIGYHRGHLRIFDDAARRLAIVDNDNLLWILFLIGSTIGLAPMIYYADFDITVLFDGMFGLEQRWSWKLERGRFGDLRGALLELQMFLRAVIPFATVIAFSSKSSTFRRAICMFFIAWMLLRANASGTRSNVIPVILPIAAAIFWKSGRDTQKWLILLGVPAALVAGYLYSVVIVANRNEGGVDFERTYEAVDNYTGFEMFRELLFILEEVPDTVDYQWGKSYANQIINPIPRYFWSGKPVWDAGLLLAEAKGYVDDNGRPVMTNSPGYIGETYLNFGIFGVVFVPFISGIIIRSWDRLFALCGQSFLVFVVYAAGLANILASGRSISISTFYGMLALYILLAILETFIYKPTGTVRRSGPRSTHGVAA